MLDLMALILSTLVVVGFFIWRHHYLKRRRILKEAEEAFAELERKRKLAQSARLSLALGFAGLSAEPFPKRARGRIRRHSLRLLGSITDENGPPWFKACPSYKDGICRGTFQLERGMPCQTFRCSGCRKFVPWCDGAADDQPEFCTPCWNKAHNVKVVKA